LRQNQIYHSLQLSFCWQDEGGFGHRYHVYYDGADASEFRLKVVSDLFDDVYDIKIFQQLPLPLRMQVLRGKVLYSDDTPFMYDKVYETIKELESFKRGYYDYLGIESIT
jgi:hypothetical protein